MVDDVTRAIEKAHCSVGEVIRKHTYYDPGTVFRQHPAPGKTLAPGSSVRIQRQPRAALAIPRFLIVCALGLVPVTGASAGWGGHDPTKNYPLRKLPLACTRAPMGSRASTPGFAISRPGAREGRVAFVQAPGQLPIAGLARQMFVLTNLDRIQYGLPDPRTDGGVESLPPW